MLEVLFPLLSSAGYDITSPETPRYNCIAWALGDDTRWWWPDVRGGFYWPSEVALEATVEAFTAAFATVAYVPSTSLDLVDGVEKVALYIGPNDRPTHAAYQRDDGAWLSKLGRSEDIVHNTLEAVSGDTYGYAVSPFERPRGPRPGV